VPDDWSLIDERLGPIARIYRINGGPQDGAWFWSVRINEDGKPWNGGTGHAAKAAVEAILSTY
jgi:hypothetical protein